MGHWCRLIVSALIVLVALGGLLLTSGSVQAGSPSLSPTVPAPAQPGFALGVNQIRLAATDAWTNCGGTPTVTGCQSMPISRAVFGMATAANGKIYVTGGLTSTSFFNRTDEYDPTTNAWTNCGGTPAVTRCAPMPTRRAYIALVATSNGKLYAMGGGANDVFGDIVGLVEEYDTASNVWTNCGGTPTVTNCRPMQIVRESPGATLGRDGKIYVAGGYVPCGGTCGGVLPTSNVEVYDPATNTWQALRGLPRALAGLGLVAANNGKLYAIGGIGDCDGTQCAVTRVDEYDPSTDAWVARTPLSIARGYLGVAVVGRKIHALGGLSGGGVGGGPLVSHQEDEVYDTATNAWTLGPNMPNPRSSHAASLADGKIYVMGGYNGNAYLNIVDEYTPPLTTVACSPRPRIVVHTARGAAGTLMVTLDAGAPAGNGDDKLATVAFGAATNARITVAAGPNGRPGLTNATGNASVILTEQPTTLAFTVTRAQAGQVTTVPIVVTDLCGTWRTFVGGGPSAF